MADDVSMARPTVKEENGTSAEARGERETADSVGEKYQAVAPDSSAKVQSVLDQLLRWLSTASNEVLGACLAGLGATTYFVLGRVGLVLIGLVGGIVLHATWEENASQSDAHADGMKERARRKREDGLKILHKVLDWRRECKSFDTDDIQVLTAAQKQLDFSNFKPATGAALTALTDAVIRDYVKYAYYPVFKLWDLANNPRWWYQPVLPRDLSFPSACRQTLTRFVLSISFHLSRKRAADVFLDFLTNSSSIIIVFLNELATALTASADTEDGPTDIIHQYLEHNPSSSLASLLDLDQQKRKLRDASDDILQSFLDRKAYDCEPVKVFLRQILAGVCLEMTVQSCSKPEWINGWIVYLLEEAEPELMNAFDAGVGKVTDTQSRAYVANTTGELAYTMESPDDPAGDGYSGHRRTVSRAEEAMDQAMQEAKRLSEMIAAEEAKSPHGSENLAASETTSGAGPTPTSSQGDLSGLANGSTPSLAGDHAAIPSAQQLPDAQLASSFTSFDQLVHSQAPTALQSGHVRTQSIVPPLTLHNASISIFDDAAPGDKGTSRSKPTFDFLLQVEPATPQHPGWMIARKYADFETLHEVLRRISVVSGVPEFADRHTAIPGWKHRSKETLRVDLENYVRDALSFSRLAESEGMKRFLEKEQGLGKSSPSAKQGGFGFPTPAAFETMGKGMLDVLAAAPKGAAGGGKAIFGGVAGVLGGVGSLGQKKQASAGNSKPTQASISNITRVETNRSPAADTQTSHKPLESSWVSANEPNRSTTSPLEAKLADGEKPTVKHDPSPSSTPDQTTQPADANDPPTNIGLALQSEAFVNDDENSLQLPPPPSEIPDDWSTSPPPPPKSASTEEPILTASSAPSSSIPPAPRPYDHELKPPLTEPETRVAVELFFATITAVYTLSSSVWSIRRTLLTAAKNFLLRPGNPNLEAIRVLIQDSVIDANISDAGLAGHIRKIRENALPTEAELKDWPPPMGPEEKARLKLKARKLLVEKGMPQALTSVMGQAASGEAVGRVFDALQVEEVARGVMFALVLQALRAVTQ
ncbi:MAG: hypothetical protein LQ344_005066 [Seirophora lacunosa]|nr:MAG: hypothetical protein LQ344_005066 [Seirophora lacunosa]